MDAIQRGNYLAGKRLAERASVELKIANYALPYEIS
jgi:hypothetical protein